MDGWLGKKKERKERVRKDRQMQDIRNEGWRKVKNGEGKER